MTQLSTLCPFCETNGLESVVASGSGAVPIDGSKQVKAGDRIHVCANCGTVASNKGKPAAAKRKPAAKRTTAKRASTKRRPAAAKRKPAAKRTTAKRASTKRRPAAKRAPTVKTPSSPLVSPPPSSTSGTNVTVTPTPRGR